MRYVELCGAPGVGKSTLMKAIADDVLPWREMRRARAKIGSVDLKSGGGSLYWRQSTMRSLERAAGIRNLPGDGWAADDHGPLQRAHWLGMIGEPWPYLKQMPFPDLAVVCRAGYSVIRERIRNRDKEDTSRQTPFAMVSTNVVLDWLQRHKANVLDLDMTLPVEENADRIREAMSC